MGVVMAPTQRPGRSAAWKSLPAMPIEPKPVGPGTNPPALAVREAWAVDLDGPQTLIDERLEPRIAGDHAVDAPMRRRRRPRGSRQSPGRFEPRLVNAGRASIAQVSCEDLAHTGHLARSRQVIGQMAPAQAGAGKTRRTASRSIESPAFAVVHHCLDSLGSTGAERTPLHCRERRVIVADEMPQDVDLTAIVLAGQLDPGDQFNTPPHRLGPGHRQGGDRVVVGDRQCRQADPCRGDDDFTRRANPVGMGRVDVQVSTVAPVPGG